MAIELTNFQNEIKRTPEFSKQVPQSTAWRYTKGKLPKAVQHLMLYPALLRALAEDAEAAATDKQAA